MFRRGVTVLACVSGGADSMAMLDILLEISKIRGFSVIAAHYNHKLRGEESERDENFVREICANRDIQLYCESGDVVDYAKKNGIGIEAAARDLRYRFFYAAAADAGAERIATAHTADDNAETIIMNLTRGAGTTGISGIPPMRPQKSASTVIRPLLCLSREDIMRFIQERDIRYVEDSTNSQDIYTRNKIRHNVMPVLKEINPNLGETMAVAAQLARNDEEYLSDLADSFIAQHGLGDKPQRTGLKVKALMDAPSAVSGRVVRKMYAGVKTAERTEGGEQIAENHTLSFKHINAVLNLCGNNKPSASVSLPGMIVKRVDDCIVFERTHNS